MRAPKTRRHHGETPGSPPASWRHALVPWLISLCAALAVGIVVVLTASISDDRPAGFRAHVSVTTGPRYLLTVELPEREGTGQRVGIREVSTGRVIQTIRFPAGVTEFSDVAGMADGRTFFLTAPVGDRQWQIFRLSVDGKGRAGLPEPVRHGRVHDPVGLAVTPDGTSVAFGVNHMEVSGKFGETPGEIDLLNLATGRRTAWKTRTWGQLGDLSLSEDGKRLAFEWSSASADKGSGIRVLDTTRRGELLRSSRLLVPSAGALSRPDQPVISPDGAILTLAVVQRDQQTLWSRLIEVGTATGRQTRVLYQERYVGEPLVATTCRSGRYLLNVDGGRTLQIDTTTGRAVRLPYPAAAPDQVAC